MGVEDSAPPCSPLSCYLLLLKCPLLCRFCRYHCRSLSSPCHLLVASFTAFSSRCTAVKMSIASISLLSFSLTLFLLSSACGCGDLFHAHCEQTWTVENAQCSRVKEFLAQQFKSCCADPDIMKNYTQYQLMSVNDSVVQGNITFTDKYVDVQTISLSQSGPNCIADACSVSHSLSFYGYDANFCDSYNLIRGGGFNFSYTLQSCLFHPSSGQEEAVCNKVLSIPWRWIQSNNS